MTRTLALVAIVAGAVFGTGGFVALAQQAPSSQRAIAGPRSAPSTAPTAPPLPFGDQSKAASGQRRTSIGGGTDVLTAFARLPLDKKLGVARLVPFTGKRPFIPKLTDLLNHKYRKPMNAYGGTIVLTGTSSVPYLDDQTLSYGSNVYWLCENLTASTKYQYVLFPPDGTAYYVYPQDYVNGGNPTNFTTDTQGRCEDTAGTGRQYPFYAQLNLETPLNGTDPTGTVTGGTQRVYNAGTGYDPAYSGVWTIAVQNFTTKNYEAVAYAVVLGTLNFSTYSNAAMTTKANDFASGSTVYVSASGLNPAHFYAFGFVNTSANGMPCVGSIPAGSANWGNATCFVTNASGILPTSEQLTGQYSSPASGANSVGTQSVQLYDTTTSDLISTQQISFNPSSLVWGALVPYNQTLGNGTNLGDTFATDGLLGTPGASAVEQSVTGLNYSITSGLTNGHVYRITVSNANGVVLSSTTTDTNPGFGSPQFFAAPTQFTAAGTSMASTQVAFPMNQTNFTAFGATQIPFAPNVYTAQIYDVTAGTAVGSKSFQVVSYDGTFQWTNPAGSYVNANAGGLATNVTTTLRNDAGTLYGNWTADSIKSITIRSDSGSNVTLGTQLPQAGCVPVTQVCAFDSVGQQWNIALAANVLTLTPNTAGQSLPNNATIPIPFTVSVAAGKCTTVCLLQTQITPLHGIAPSNYNATMNNTATNGLQVFGNGVVGTNTEATYTLTSGAYGVGAQLATPRYNQAEYRSGTNGAPSNTYVGGAPQSYYTFNFNVTNDSGKTIYYYEFTMPSTVNPNQLTPVLSSATVGGTSYTGSYKIYTQNGGNGATADNTLGPNAFAIVATASAAGLATSKSASFVLKLPIQTSAFPFQQIPVQANYRDVNGFGSSAQFAMQPTTTLTNAVAGTSNIDSTELGIFSLDPSLMSAQIAPSVVPALANQNWTFTYTNTSTGLDPNPDYISQLLIAVPSAGGAYPTVTSVTASNGATWNATSTGTSGQWLLSLCTVATVPTWTPTETQTPCPGTTDASSLPPAGTLTIKFNYATAPAVGNYPINWAVVGANGGGVVSATGAQIPQLVVANTTAQTDFTYAGGYYANPAHPPASPPIGTVLGNTQPQVGSWADYNEGNGYVFELYNNGSTTITNVSVAIPWSNTSGQLFDTSYPWSVDGTSVFTYGAGASGAKCSGSGYNTLTQAVNGSPGTSGLLTLSGCNLLVGQVLDIFFYAKNPYDVGSTFRFDASVATGGTTPPDPRVAGNPNTLAKWSLSNTVKIIDDARLEIQIPTGAWPSSTYTPALNGLSTPTGIGCPSCTFSSVGLVPLINLNNITGTVTVNDTLAASVYSDETAGWNLSVSADQNPGTSSGNLTTWVDQTNSSHPGAGTYTVNVASGPGTAVPTSGTLSLSSFSGAVQKRPVDNIMGYTVTVNPLSVNNNTTTTVTLTYTLIAN
ncbi:MAG TPA: hypothetical protein VHT05_10620 [Candidatus Elarobacter sp.]|nr:hypothetical protein [Candidatus Elarobacter sp.]